MFLIDLLQKKKKKMKIFDDAVFSNHDIVFVNVAFSSDGMAILRKRLSNIILNDVIFDENDPETIIDVRLMAFRNIVKQRKAFKKDISKY